MNIINTICRICRHSSNDGNLKSMITSGLLQAYSFCTDLMISEDHEKYYKICEACVNLLIQFSDFKKLCIESDQYFKAVINVHVKTERSKDPLEYISDEDSGRSENKDDFIETEILTKSPRTKLSCEHCPRTFKNPRSFHKHVLSHTSIRRKKDCEDTEMVLLDEIKLENDEDMFVDIPNNKSVCNVCGKQLATSSLRIHMKRHRGEKNIECNICALKFYDTGALLKHNRRIHDQIKDYQCSICESKFYTSAELKTHLIVHSNERPFKCDLCGSRFKSKYVLRTHINKHPNMDHRCHICQKTFSNKIDLKSHVLNHIGDNHYKCKICLTDFIYLTSFKQHAKTDHPDCELENCIEDIKMLLENDNAVNEKKEMETKKAINLDSEKLNTCHVCGKTFKLSAILKVHMRRHTGEKPYQCDKCEYKCVERCQLLVHQRRKHDNVKKYRCCKCSFQSVTSTQLLKHMHSHSDEKPYACDQCDSSFKTSSSLIIHKRSHTGEKPYRCTYCEKSFAALPYLKYHLAIHTGEKKFACKICDRKFNQRTPLVKHMLVHLNGEGKYSKQI